MVASYELLKLPPPSPALTAVATAANELKALGFTVLTAQFGEFPVITVAPTLATRQLAGTYAGVQCNGGGQLLCWYQAAFMGLVVQWFKPIKPNRRLH